MMHVDQHVSNDHAAHHGNCAHRFRSHLPFSRICRSVAIVRFGCEVTIEINQRRELVECEQPAEVCA